MKTLRAKITAAILLIVVCASCWGASWDGGRVTKPIQVRLKAGYGLAPFEIWIGGSKLFGVTTAGAITTAGGVTFGVNGTGTDFQLYGAASGNNLLWDASDNRLEGTGTCYALFGESTTGVNAASPNPMVRGSIYSKTTAVTGTAIGVRGDARAMVASTGGTFRAGQFIAGNAESATSVLGVDVLTATGLMAGLATAASGGNAKAITNGRGIEVTMDMDQADTVVTNGDGIYVNLNAGSTGATHGTVYGLRILNEANGGTGQEFDSAIRIEDLNMSGGVHGWDYGLDLRGMVSIPHVADIVLSNGERIDNLTDGTLNLTATTIKATGNLATTGSLTIDDVVYTAPIMVVNKRQRVTLTALNSAAVEILPAVSGKKYRIVDLNLTAYGGSLAATANATGVKITGWQTSEVALVSYVLAALVRSIPADMSLPTHVTVLADGAGLMVCDANKPINLDVITASTRDLITATGIDVDISYVVEE